MPMLADSTERLGDLVDAYDAVRAGLKDAPEFIPVYYARLIGLLFIFRLRRYDPNKSYFFAPEGFSDNPAVCLLKHFWSCPSYKEPKTDDRNRNDERWKLLHLFNHIKMEDWIKLQTNPGAEMTTTKTLPWLWINYCIHSAAFYSLARCLGWPLRMPRTLSKAPLVPEPVRNYAMYAKQDFWSLVTAVRLVFGDNGHTWRLERLALEAVGYSHDFEQLFDVNDYHAYTVLPRKRGEKLWTENDFLLAHTLEYDMAHKAVNAGCISSRRDGQTGMIQVEPGSYLKWVRSKGFVLAKELDAVRSIPANQKTKTKVHGKTVNAEKGHEAIVKGVRRLLADFPKKHRLKNGRPNYTLIATNLYTSEELKNKYIPDVKNLPGAATLARIISKGLKNSVE